MKLYKVTVECTVVVVGDNEKEAEVNARADLDTIVSNEGDFFHMDAREITSEKELDEYWANSYPYGTDAILTCKEILCGSDTDKEDEKKTQIEDPNQMKFDFYEGTRG